MEASWPVRRPLWSQQGERVNCGWRGRLLATLKGIVADLGHVGKLNKSLPRVVDLWIHPFFSAGQEV